MSKTSHSFTLNACRPMQVPDMTRVGRVNDGGYVVPLSGITGADALVSIGINDDWSFEQGARALNPGLQLLCVDGTTSLPRIVKKAFQKSVDMLGYLVTLKLAKFRRNAAYLTRPFQFRRFFSDVRLLQKMVGPASSAGVVTMEELFSEISDRVGHDSRVILKVDIEGAEFQVLPGFITSAQMAKVNLLIVEFHDLHDNWSAFQQLLANLRPDFDVVHVHGNNFQEFIPESGVPLALELTFLRKAPGAAPLQPSTREYPLPHLDMPNNWQKEDMKLSFD